jgi:kynureninase
MVAASFMPRRFRSDGPVVYYLSASIKGESRHRYIRKGEVEYWRKRASAWRRFMKAMVSWVKVSKEIEKELREIGRLRCEALPGGRRMREGLRGG